MPIICSFTAPSPKRYGASAIRPLPRLRGKGGGEGANGPPESSLE